MKTADEQILAGIIKNNVTTQEVARTLKDNIALFVANGGPELIQDKNLKALASITVQYHQHTRGEFLSKDELSHILTHRATARELATSLEFAYAQAASHQLPQEKYRWWVREARELDRGADWALALQKAATIYEGKVQDADNVAYSGAMDSILFLQQEIPRILGKSSIHTTPTGDIRRELEQVLDEIDKAERGETQHNLVMTGYDFIDSYTNGLTRGDFILIGAHTGEGKSQLCANIAYNVCVHAGLNVQVITAETARDKYRRRVFTRHTHHPAVGVVGGIPYNNIKSGRWDDDTQRRTFVETAKDFTTNKAYGIFDITQITAGSTIEDVRAKADTFQQTFGVALDILVVDYLSLLSASTKRVKRQEEINDILRIYKEFCLTFNNGTGLIGFAAHQSKQEIREKVKPEPGKFYTVRDYADTSEAGKSIDVGVMLLRTDDMKKSHELAAGLVKNRDGECPTEITTLFEDYATSYIGNVATAA